MDALLIAAVVNGSNSLNGVYRDSDRGQYIQVSNRQYVIGDKPEKATPIRVDIDKQTIFLKKDSNDKK